MGSKQDDYNRGQKDGAKAGGFDEFVESNFSLESPEYRKGFEHGRRQQVEARAKEPVKIVPSSNVNTPSDHDSGGGGVGVGVGGGGGGGGATGKGCLIILFLIVAIPAGLLIQRNKKRAYIADLATVRMSIRVGGQDVDESGAVRYAHGRPQTVRIFIDWEPQAIYWSERPIRVALSRNGQVRYNRLWKHDELVEFNGLVFDITDTFPIGRYLIVVSVEGAQPAQRSFVVEPRPPGNVFVSDVPPEWPRQAQAMFQLRPGETKKLFTYIRINGNIPQEGRTVYISLVHDGVALFNYSNHITEQNRDFYIPYEAAFSEGSYTTRLSAEDEPPAEFNFTVQYPIVESADERNRQIKQFMDAVLPGSPQSNSAPANTATPNGSPATPAAQVPNQAEINFPDCYSGTWKENEPNGFVWYFRRLGNDLRISRSDGSVAGQFQKSSYGGWLGSVTWTNGPRWDGVVLNDANEACNEITTNQEWWFKR